jgi:glycerol-3-phosphate dehydrogenase (NAD(P)+)
MARHVAVLGAGSWGTALAKLLADKGTPVRLWARRSEQADAIQHTRQNERYLRGFELPKTLEATSDLARTLDGAEMVVSVVPSHGLREVLDECTKMLPDDAPVVSASKGIENSTLRLVSEIYEEHLPKDRHRLLTALSGPSFAKEVAAGMPTAVSCAGHDADVCLRVQSAFSTDRFRVYTTDDLVGVEIGGALKNVIAIAAGIADGLGFGHNTRAALITRGLAEISRLGMKRGAHPLTLAGLAGMGDLVLTCTGDLSRNRSVGLELGRGRKLADVLGGMTMVAEGVKTTKSAYDLARREGVDMPIVEAVHEVLYDGRPPIEAVVALMTRAPRPERD